MKDLIYRYWRKKNLIDVELFNIALFYEEIVKQYHRKGSGKIFVSELVSHDLLDEMKYLNSDFVLLRSDIEEGREYSSNVQFVDDVEDLRDLNFVFSFHKTFNLMLDSDSVISHVRKMRSRMEFGAIYVLETELYNREVFQPYSRSWSYESLEYDLNVKIIDEDMDFFHSRKRNRIVIKKKDGSMMKSFLEYRIYTISELKTIFQTDGMFEMINVYNPYYMEDMDPEVFDGHVIILFRAI